MGHPLLLSDALKHVLKLYIHNLDQIGYPASKKTLREALKTLAKSSYLPSKEYLQTIQKELEIPCKKYLPEKKK